jgi:hypothetical protein
MSELYDGQLEKLQGDLKAAEHHHQADQELLEQTADLEKRRVIFQRLAGREGHLSTLRRQIAKLEGEADPGARNKVVRLRLTDDEYEQLQSSAESQGVTLSQYIRDKAVG